jgi:tRNA threonylcarbamoyl adenosine modification protein YeaZ
VTVALHDGTHVLVETTTVDARRHGELLASSIDAVLAEAGTGRLDITAVAAGTGPGPYTGLRAGLVTARVLGSALGVPVYGVCTLDVVAAGVPARARRGGGVHRPPTPGGAGLGALRRRRPPLPAVPPSPVAGQ